MIARENSHIKEEYSRHRRLLSSDEFSSKNKPKTLQICQKMTPKAPFQRLLIAISLLIVLLSGQSCADYATKVQRARAVVDLLSARDNDHDSNSLSNYLSKEGIVFQNRLTRLQALSLSASDALDHWSVVSDRQQARFHAPFELYECRS